MEKHWPGGFVSPNKRTRMNMHMLQTLKDNCSSFEDYHDLVSLLESCRRQLIARLYMNF